MRKLFDRFAAAAACRTFQLKQSLTELKKDERGLSGVVVAVLLILVAVLAVAAIWTFLSKYLTDTFSNIAQPDSSSFGSGKVTYPK